MAKAPRKPDDIFDDYTRDVQALFKEDLVAIILFGSGARGDFVYKKSDINFMIVVQENGMARLPEAFSLVKKWSKRSVAVPLFLTENYVKTSLDSFPIEFLNLKLNHRLVYGSDVLADLEISRNDLRLKCEEQIKGKLLHMREEFLRTMGQKQRLQNLVSLTVPTLASIFSGLLLLKNAEIPVKKEDIFIKTAQVFGLDNSIFQKVLNVRSFSEKLAKNELLELLTKYINEIEKLAGLVDLWQN